MQVFKDSFDTGLTAAQHNDRKWSGFANGGFAAIGTTFGRNGTNGGQISSSVSPTTVSHGSVWKNVPNLNTYGIALAWRFEQSYASDSRCVVSFHNATGQQIQIRHLSDGTIQALRGSTVLGTSAGSWSQTTFNHMEVRVFIDNAAGTVEVRINGTVALSLTGIDTQNQAAAGITQIKLSSGVTESTNVTGNNEMWVDDVIIWDTTGTKHNTFHGDRRIYALNITGAGASAQFTPTAGQNYENVDDTAPDDDTTVNASGTVGHIDSLAFADLPSNALVIGALTVNLWARKDDAGDRQIAAKARLAGTYATGPNHALITTYANYQTHFEVDPATADWTRPNINAGEIGYEVRT